MTYTLLLDYRDYCACYEVSIRTAKAGGRIPIKRSTGVTSNISEYTSFSYYDYVYFWDTPRDISNPKIGR